MTNDSGKPGKEKLDGWRLVFFFKKSHTHK